MIAADYAWLAALIEGEGYVSPPGLRQRRVSITNQNVFVLDRAAEILERAGIPFSSRFDPRDKTVSLAIYGGRPAGTNFRRLYDAVGEYLVSWKHDSLRHMAEAQPYQQKNCEPGCSCGRHRSRAVPGSRRSRRGYYEEVV